MGIALLFIAAALIFAPRTFKSIGCTMVRSLAFNADTVAKFHSRRTALLSSVRPGMARTGISSIRPKSRIGRSLIRNFSEVIAHHQIQLGKVEGKRTNLSLATARRGYVGLLVVSR